MIASTEDTLANVAAQIDQSGFACLHQAISIDQIEHLKRLCAASSDASTVARRNQSVYGIRNLLSEIPAVRGVVSAAPFQQWAEALLGSDARPVDGVFFDKTPDANWPIPWHQDVTIRVREQKDVDGFEARPVKDGFVHMLPPVEVSENILAMRIHLDDATASHGALRVIAGSHRLGRLNNEQLQQQMTSGSVVHCEMHAGDIMFMRPLLIHSSSACERPAHRRVVHIEYAAFDLPGGLQWQG